jgi:hypothetical protein
MKPNLLTLPLELHLHLFKHLEIVTATYLGLTNKHLYSIFRAVYGHKLPILLCNALIVKDNGSLTHFSPCDLLETWMRPLVLGMKVNVPKFITLERYWELEIAIEEERRRRSIPHGFGWDLA